MRLLEGSNKFVDYLGFGVGCWDPFEGLEEVSVLAINAQTLFPQVTKFSLLLSEILVFSHEFVHYWM